MQVRAMEIGMQTKKHVKTLKPAAASLVFEKQIEQLKPVAKIKAKLKKVHSQM